VQLGPKQDLAPTVHLITPAVEQITAVADGFDGISRSQSSGSGGILPFVDGQATQGIEQ
jgi:hypothetical protein